MASLAIAAALAVGAHALPPARPGAEGEATDRRAGDAREVERYFALGVEADSCDEVAYFVRRIRAAATAKAPDLAARLARARPECAEEDRSAQQDSPGTAGRFELPGEPLSGASDPARGRADPLPPPETCAFAGAPGDAVHRIRTLDDFQRACREAGPGHTLAFRRAALDLTGFAKPIELQDGMRLIGERRGLRRGSLLFVTDDFHWGERRGPGDYPKVRLFRARGRSGITIRGLRFRGPFNSRKKDIPKVTAIHLLGARDVLVEGNELFHWSGQAVLVEEEREGYLPLPMRRDEPDRPDQRPRALERHWRRACAGSAPAALDDATIRIRGNHFHDNRRKSAGYGVNVSKGARAIIEANVFDRNRHAVASDGNFPASYRAAHNYVLEGGDPYEYTLWFDAWDQHFDVHGVGEDGYGGIGGNRFELIANTIRGEQSYYLGARTRPALMLRGTPCQPVRLNGNVLVHERDEVVRVKADTRGIEGPRLEKVGNEFDVDRSRELIAADVDGDGRDDVVLMSGAGWYVSYGGMTDWRHLRRSRRTRSDTLVGDFDCDGRADAIVRSSNGRWTRISLLSGRRARLGSSEEPLRELRVGDFDGNGCDDVFRAGDGRWQVREGGAAPWQHLNTSVFPVRRLGFADFDGDGATDVFRIGEGRWWISRGGREPWQRLGPGRRDPGELASLAFADVDGNGSADVILRERHPFGARGRGAHSWRIAYDGVGGWRPYLSAAPEVFVFGRFHRGPSMPLTYGAGRHFVVWRDGDAPERHSWHPMR